MPIASHPLLGWVAVLLLLASSGLIDAGRQRRAVAPPVRPLPLILLHRTPAAPDVALSHAVRPWDGISRARRQLPPLPALRDTDGSTIPLAVSGDRRWLLVVAGDQAWLLLPLPARSRPDHPPLLRMAHLPADGPGQE